MTIKKILFLFYIIFFLINERSFAQMAELPLSQKIENSTDIFEGKVILKSCFWNAEHTLIFTTNTIEVYKIFKGDSTLSKIAVWTEGGQVGDEMQGSGSGLELKEGDIGVFMVELVSHAEENGAVLKFFRVYGGPQGFIKYDLLEKTASDPFKKYTSIPEDVYKAITDKTGKPFREIKSFNIDNPNGTNSKKKRTWFSCCKKKKMSK